MGVVRPSEVGIVVLGITSSSSGTVPKTLAITFSSSSGVGTRTPSPHVSASSMTRLWMADRGRR